MREPGIVDSVFATVAHSEGNIAACYWMSSKHVGVPLVMFDWFSGQFTPAFWTQLLGTLEAVRDRVRIRYDNLGVWTEGPSLAQHAAMNGIPARAVPDWLTTTEYWPRLAFSASCFIKGGFVKLTDNAQQKSSKQAFGGISYRGGERGDDPTVPAFLYGVALALDESAAVDPKGELMHALSQSVAARS